jgi:hypothetical protein
MVSLHRVFAFLAIVATLAGVVCLALVILFPLKERPDESDPRIDDPDRDA